MTIKRTLKHEIVMKGILRSLPLRYLVSKAF